MKSKDNKYAKVEGLLKLYPEIERRKENAMQFQKLGEDRSRELVELETKKKIVDNMLDGLREKSEEDYKLIKMWYFEKRTRTYIALELNMCEKTVWWRKRKIITEYLMSFVS